MMDFFERQERAKKKTGQLIFLFVLSVIAITFCIYLATVFVLRTQEPVLFSNGYFHKPLFFGVSLLVLTIVTGGSLWKIAALSRGGGRSVAQMLGGRLVDLNTTNFKERQLMNVVEEMAIASSVPVPEIYILDKEKAINAFAAGHMFDDAAIGVTQGCLQELTREELQGVIAHEFSHILNGDMKLNIRLMGFLHGILLIALIGYHILRSTSRHTYYQTSSSRKKGGNPLPLFGLILLIIGYVGVFFARLIKAGVSRQREFLADAAAVQFTRNPLGLAGALKKISISGSSLITPNAETASHLFFSNGLKKQWLQLTSTHPPLEERIKSLDPTWKGRLTEELSAIKEHTANDTGSPPFVASSPNFSVDQWLSHVGSPQPQHAHYASAFHQTVASPFEAVLHESSGACAVIFALLLHKETSLYKHQMEIINNFADPAVSKTVQHLAPRVFRLEPSAKLPLAELALPALKLLSPVQYQDFKTLLHQLVRMDKQVSFFEFMLQKIVQKHLDFLLPTRHKKVISHHFPWQQEARVLLSAIARIGANTETRANQAFEKGWKIVAEENQMNQTLLPSEESNLAKLNAAIDRLANLPPTIKKKVILAIATAISSDEMIKSEEGELLRAICSIWECPVPPLI